MLEDKAGNIWFGSADAGACRYDGKTFTDFSATDPPRLPARPAQARANDQTSAIAKGEAGSLASRAYQPDLDAAGGNLGVFLLSHKVDLGNGLEQDLPRLRPPLLGDMQVMLDPVGLQVADAGSRHRRDPEPAREEEIERQLPGDRP
jgi:hypothetical protein